MELWRLRYTLQSGEVCWHTFGSEAAARAGIGDALRLGRPGSVRVERVLDPAALIGRVLRDRLARM